MRKVMTPFDLFQTIIDYNSSEISFPFYYEKPDDYFDYVCKTIDTYLAQIETCEDKSIMRLNNCLASTVVPFNKELNLLADIKEINDVIKNCITYLYKGNIPSAYGTLEKFFTDDRCHYLMMLPMIYVSDGMSFYRIRNKKNLSKQREIFHVPFNLRTKVRTERYSIPGYPVLYLSSSFVCAWEETGKKDLSNLSFSTFRLEKGDYYIVDFVPPIDDDGWPLYTWLLFYPLIMACSVDVKIKEDPYKPEYALPQLFLQVLRDHAINGIIGLRYLSAQAPAFNPHDGSYHSFVFPTTCSDKKDGYCPRLSKLFQFSEPVQLPQRVIDEATESKRDDWFMKSGINIKPIIDFANTLKLLQFTGQ